MTPGLTWRSVLRARHVPFLVAMILATAALITVSLLDGRLHASLTRHAAAAFGADLVLTRTEPFPLRFLKAIRTPGITETRLVRFPTVVGSGGETHLTELNAVGIHYPLLGRVHLKRQRGGASQILTRGPQAGKVWITPELLAALGARVGGELEVGYAKLVISGLLARAPAVTSAFALFAPPILINRQMLVETRLVGTQSRIEYELLVRGSADAVRMFSARVRRQGRGLAINVITPRKQAAQIHRALSRTEHFLGLAITGTLFLAFLTLLLSARDAARLERSEVALLRVFGLKRGALLRHLMLERAIQVGIGTVLGGALGFGCYRLVLNGVAPALAGSDQGFFLLPTFVTTLVATAFLSYASALPAWFWLFRISPAEALRSEPPREGWGAGQATASVMVLIVSYGFWYALGGGGSLRYLAISLSLILTVSALAFLSLRLLGRSLSRMHAELGWVLSSLNRRPAFVALSLASLTLIIFVLVFLETARTSLYAGYGQMFGPATPNWFVIGIEPGERTRLKQLLQRHQIKARPFAPLYVARLIALNGHRLRARETHNPGRRFWIRHDQSLSASATLPAGDRIVAGHFWPDGTHDHDASLVRGFAHRMDVHLGDRLEYQVAGTRFSTRITSLRTVRWDHMTPNFFVLLSPASVRGLPHSYLTAVRAPETARTFLSRLPSRFPGVTVIDIRLLIRELRHLLTRAAQAISVLMLSTLAAALLLAYLVVALTREERTREITLFRTLGVRITKIMVWLAIEYGLLGLLAGALGALAAGVVGWLDARTLLDVRFQPDWPVLLAAPWVTAACTLGLGFLALAPTLSASRTRFWQALNSR